jgi:hypothetical protein
MASTERIEIRPGYFIEVSGRLKRMAGVRGRKPRNRITDEERKRIFADNAAKNFISPRYSRLILDEAVNLSKTVGMVEAAKVTGVKYWSIVGHKRTLKRQGKYTPGAQGNHKSRYTMQQKKRCVALANQIRDESHCATRKAFIEAGRRLGINGRSIEWQHSQGSIT